MGRKLDRLLRKYETLTSKEEHNKLVSLLCDVVKNEIDKVKSCHLCGADKEVIYCYSCERNLCQDCFDQDGDKPQGACCAQIACYECRVHVKSGSYVCRKCLDDLNGKN